MVKQKAISDYKKCWQECISYMHEQYVHNDKQEELFTIWFGDLSLDSYDVQDNKLQISVPNKQTWAYLETNARLVFFAALQLYFGSDVKLTYRIAAYAPTFADMAKYLQRRSGREMHSNHIHIDNARNRMEEGLKYFLKDKPMQWLKGYDRIANWLDDNDNRGLLVVGPPGLGKSLITQSVLPVLLADGLHSVPCVSAMDINKRLDELKQARIVVVDDLGKEPRKHYGDVDNSFLELCDNAERTGAILVITTNLSTTPTDDPCYSDSILNRYGKAVISKLRAITHVAIIEGEDMR